MKTLNELKEQLQEDIITYLDDIVAEDEVTELCQKVVNRVNELKHNIQTEYRVYCIDMDDDELYAEDFDGVWDLSDEKFIEHAERQGLVWSLEGFQEAFNQDGVSDTWIMRIIKHS
jgi:hypothetical protein